jgi:phosphatidylglycerophosphate synthase
MGKSPELGSRRPLKSRSTRWAQALARLLLKSGISADAISVLGIVFACLGAVALVEGRRSPWLFVAAAGCIQLRLLCNLLDGMIAIEGGRKSVYGPIYNELPDRIEDSVLLIAFGYAAGPITYAVGSLSLGLLAALLAAICAYVRLLGGTLGQEQDFRGPMAKPHRMAALTVAAVAAAVAAMALPYDSGREDIVPPLGNLVVFVILNGSLFIIILGTLVTIVRRVLHIARSLRAW